ncbi:SDR family oxidoreductase [Brachybacterium sp. YJGR34]|uniref:SDR family oxidoreductase n=1 Tax=Brachybacterium sp. YJGR34 TaxID=2059911 RepID=UPI000E0A85B8|nr:NAD(P)H-binding protein [Brachybacterium sp. YJGR34]
MTTAPPLLVTGGTGTIGSQVVPMLRRAGAEVRVLSRHPRTDSPGIRHVQGDTVAGTGLAAALDGVETVLHLAGGAKGDDVAAQNLAAAAREAGVGHLLLISVIGADAMPIGYFRAKAAAERSLVASGVPFTILRAAQLHEFVLPLARGLSRLPLLPLAGGLRFEPIHVQEVAARLVELALDEPAGRVPDLAGPAVLDVRALADAYAEVHGRRRRRGIPIRVPGAIGRAYRAGENLAGAGADRGAQGWREFLLECRAEVGIRAVSGLDSAASPGT